MLYFAPALALLASVAAASPLTSRQTEIPSGWNWHVTGWEGGCSRGGCSYNFNVTVPRVEGYIAGVKAYCRGYEDGYWAEGPNHFSSCQILEGSNNGVAAKFSQRHDGISPEKILISVEKGAYMERPAYNFTGSHDTIYNAAVKPLQEFDVTPTEVFGIA